MNDRVTVEQRLEYFAQEGLTKGFTLRLWGAKAKSLIKKGITLYDKRPTSRKGEARYKIDFSNPIPGTYSEVLYNLAMENRAKSNDEVAVSPLTPPYVQED